MIEMTDERAAEVLAAHNEWRRYDGFPGEPGAPAMGDPAELGRAIDHVVSRLRSKPPAEEQPSAPVGVEGSNSGMPAWTPGSGTTGTPATQHFTLASAPPSPSSPQRRISRRDTQSANSRVKRVRSE